MLLIAPPLQRDQWLQARRYESDCSSFFGRFCSRYADTVVNLPWNRLEPLLGQLTQGMEHQTLTSAGLHAIVERQWKETQYESSSKVARLILLRAFVRSVQSAGVRIQPMTERLLKKCDELVPMLLMMAVDDHYGLLEV